MAEDDDSIATTTPRRRASCTSCSRATGEPGFDAAAWRDVARWRKAERERLIAARLAISAENARRMTVRIAAGNRRAGRRSQ